MAVWRFGLKDEIRLQPEGIRVDRYAPHRGRQLAQPGRFAPQIRPLGSAICNEINASWITTYPAIIQSLKNLPKEKRDEVIRIFGQLLIKYRKVLGESVKETVKENVMAQGKQMLEKIREPSQLSGM